MINTGGEKVYVDEVELALREHPGVRVEACETCHRYLKSIDLSQDARPLPEVDDLASLPLDLWAIEQGFTRIEPGLAGV